jgi:hypothetical protein
MRTKPTSAPRRRWHLELVEQVRVRFAEPVRVVAGSTTSTIAAPVSMSPTLRARQPSGSWAVWPVRADLRRSR